MAADLCLRQYELSSWSKHLVVVSLLLLLFLLLLLLLLLFLLLLLLSLLRIAAELKWLLYSMTCPKSETAPFCCRIQKSSRYQIQNATLSHSRVIVWLAGTIGEHAHGVLVALDWLLQWLKDRIRGVFLVELLHFILLSLVCSLQQLLRQGGVLLKQGRVVAPEAVQQLELGLLLQNSFQVTLLNGILQLQNLGSIPCKACGRLALRIGPDGLAPKSGHWKTSCLKCISPVQACRHKCLRDCLEGKASHSKQHQGCRQPCGARHDSCRLSKTQVDWTVYQPWAKSNQRNQWDKCSCCKLVFWEPEGTSQV